MPTFTATTSAQNAHGGQESTILSLYTTAMHWGAVIVAPGFTDPAVAEAAVVGRTDDLKGQALVAFVTLKSGIHADEALRGRVRAAVETALEPYVTEGRATMTSACWLVTA